MASDLADAYPLDVVGQALAQYDRGATAGRADVLDEVGAVDRVPHGSGGRDRILLGELGESGEERAGVAERGLAQVGKRSTYQFRIARSEASTYTVKSKKSLTTRAPEPSLRGLGGCSTLSPSTMRMSGWFTVIFSPGTMSYTRWL